MEKKFIEIQTIKDIRGVPKFIRSTYRIVDESRDDEIIGWSEDGNDFIIKNP